MKLLGETPEAHRTARAKERVDLYPASKDNFLIDVLGAEARRLLTLLSKTSSRRSLNFLPVIALTAF